MSDLKDGDYVFKVAAGSQPLAGIDIGSGFPAPIITNGHENVWTLTTEPEGNRKIVSKTPVGTLYTLNEGENLVGIETPTLSIWNINGPDSDGFYTIRVPLPVIPTKVWTVKNTDPKQPVTLNDPDPDLPRNQKWQIFPFKK